MAGSTLTNLSQRFSATAAAVAAAAGGTVVTADIQRLADVLALLALSPDISIPLLGQASTPITASSMLTPS
jgi:hypothetical protein